MWDQSSGGGAAAAGNWQSDTLSNADVVDSRTWRNRVLKTFETRVKAPAQRRVALIPQNWRGFQNVLRPVQWAANAGAQQWSIGNFLVLVMGLEAILNWGGLTTNVINSRVMLHSERVGKLPRWLSRSEAGTLLRALNQDGRYFFRAVRNEQGNGWDFVAIPLVLGESEMLVSPLGADHMQWRRLRVGVRPGDDIDTEAYKILL
jgi:hypothetical protein